MTSRIDRRALILGGAALGAGATIAHLLRDSKQATAQRVAQRNQTKVLSPPTIVSRSQWGADETLRHGPPEFDSEVDKIVVHHTGTRNDAPDWATAVREIYEFETSNGYNDLSYHFLVDHNGMIYEGRWARDYPEGTVPDSENADAQQVQGGHAKEHNRRTIGIALLGDFNTAFPSALATDALVDLLVWKCSRWELDPLGESEYALDHGGVATLPNVFGHGTVRQTECPGTNLTAVFPTVLDRTAAAIVAA